MISRVEAKNMDTSVSGVIRKEYLRHQSSMVPRSYITVWENKLREM